MERLKSFGITFGVLAFKFFSEMNMTIELMEIYIGFFKSMSDFIWPIRFDNIFE